MRLDLDVKYVRDQITALLLANPELADDEVLREDMIIGETITDEFIAKILRNIGATRALMNGTSEYVRELKDRIERLERRELALRSLIQNVLTSADLQKIELPEGTVSLRYSPPKVIIVDEQELPQEFWRIRKEPDKQRIGTALKAREHVPGACLSNSEVSLMIRVS